jgi:hypothetical protein
LTTEYAMGEPKRLIVDPGENRLQKLFPEKIQCDNLAASGSGARMGSAAESNPGAGKKTS